MEEPPLKRQRRTDSSAMWEKSETNERGAASPRLHDSDRDSKPRKHDGGYGGRRDEDRRRRSRSPRDRHERRRSRSRSPRERSYRDRDHDRDRDRVKEEGGGGGRRDGDRSGSRDRDRHRVGKGHRSDRRHGRSRSPYRNGESTSSIRARSPAPARVKHEPRDSKIGLREKDVKDVKAVANGVVKNEMDVDDDEVDVAMKRMMGFSTFKSTQNTKVPGNQIYGVRKEKKTEYRQYMNRVGGFNRPLSPGR